MISRLGVMLSCLAIAACAVQPPPDTASVPPGTFGFLDNDVPAAMQVLASPVFTLPPQHTLQILSNMPYIQSANIATMDAARQMNGGAAWMP